jgi:archaemetzincin
MKKIFIPLLVLLGVTLYPNDLSTQKILSIKKETIIHIVPLGNIDKKYPELVKTYIEDFYGFECVIDSTQPLTKDILASSGTRYEASKIITKFNSDKNTLLLTDVDIAIFDKEKNIKEYGIIGLGFRPGKTCVVSTFRIRRHVSEKKMLDRLQKVSIHEVGHNLGLDHCVHDRKCLMNDVKGTVKQIDMEKIWLCDKCSKQIGMKNKTLK